jgi:spermidine synthase
MQILAEQAGLELSEVVYDSSAFQFWASEQYALNIPLYDNRSYAVAPKASYFTKEQIAAFEKRAKELNHAKLGDQAVFYLRRPS